MADLFSTGAGLIQGAAQTTMQERNLEEERRKANLAVLQSTTQSIAGLLQQRMQEQGAMERQKQAQEMQMIKITPQLANGLIKSTGDKSWGEMVDQMIPVPVYSSLIDIGIKKNIANWKETTEIQGEMEQKILYNETDPTQRIPLGSPGKRRASTEDRQAAISARQEKNLAVQKKGRFRNYFLDLEQRDPIIKEANKQNLNLSVVQNIIDLVKEGNTVAFSALGTKMAKAMGEVGVLTEPDVKRYVASGRLDRKAGDTLLKWIRGSPTEATQSEIAGIASVLKDTYNSKIQPRYNQFIDTYASIEDMTPEEFAKEIKLPYTGQASIANDRGGALSESEKAELAELERKYGGGQ